MSYVPYPKQSAGYFWTQLQDSQLHTEGSTGVHMEMAFPMHMDPVVWPEVRTGDRHGDRAVVAVTLDEAERQAEVGAEPRAVARATTRTGP